MRAAGKGETMRALLQRVTRSEVRVGEEVVGRIGRGLTIFLGIRGDDTPQVAGRMAEKIAGLRIFADAAGKTNLAAAEAGVGMLVISQFTLYADCRRGRRPGFSNAARPEIAEPLYEHFMAELSRRGFTVARGRFGAEMLVDINNDGPFTIFLDSDELTA